MKLSFGNFALSLLALTIVFGSILMQLGNKIMDYKIMEIRFTVFPRYESF